VAVDGDLAEASRPREHLQGVPGASFFVRRCCFQKWRRSGMVKVEAMVIRDRVETVIDAVEEATGHVGVTVIEAVGHGRQRGITHEYRGRVFESRFLPKAMLIFVVEDRIAALVVDAIVDAARTGHESGDGLVWTSPVADVVHHRTGQKFEEGVEIGA
jgi:nitrogen regulatory protein P-II 1